MQQMSKEYHPDAYLRLKTIIGDKRNGVPGILPMGASTFWAGVASGRYPKPTKLGPRITVWRAADIINLTI
ncbi:helix-turn-helix transcriptional regulator [Sphingorhabdus sp.]|jgi:prophage regulatory protein|uniref:helix-turn-helix transcriptional regulator n=1 Tax=Sphingorhabdus sp. TaxID=1902408 RepID=UPI0037C7324E